MVCENSCNMWVFREGRITVGGVSALDGLGSALRNVSSPNSSDALINALLRAGELECALADVLSLDQFRSAEITDALAAALVGLPGCELALQDARALLGSVSPPISLCISTPEGFAYYAVHPLDFAALADQVALPEGRAAVVGIRSIGTTLSAVATASLKRRGVRSERTTVRPVGHPYDRRTSFTAQQLRWIARQRAASAHFLVVDEGPGLSGSSFLSVGDALLEAGVARERITFLGSRYPDPEVLTARDGAARWRSFRSLAVGATAFTPAERGSYIGGGEWRRLIYDDESRWPESWVQMERLKFLSSDQRRLFIFHGLGRFGRTVAERARLVGEAGYGPRLLAHSGGFSEFCWLRAQPMDGAQISAAVLERVADYCTFRLLEFASRPPADSQLEAMTRFNVAEVLGRELAARVPGLETRRAVIADGRMLPHEWLLVPGGLIMKTDAATHGDDHFFPGPVDIAWDLAGAIVEWGMTADAAQYMLDRYRRRSGDDPRGRISAYLLAYAVFRMALCSMAAFALHGSSEEQRLRRAATHYRNLVEVQLHTLQMPPRGLARPAAEYLREPAAKAEPRSSAN
jgi:hypothetical protein